jgi:hypothetical protein
MAKNHYLFEGRNPKIFQIDMTRKTSRIPTQDIHEVMAKLTVVCTNYVTVLSRKTGISRTTVSKFFNDQKVSVHNQEKIFDAACNLILDQSEVSRNRAKMIEQIRSLR